MEPPAAARVKNHHWEDCECISKQTQRIVTLASVQLCSVPLVPPTGRAWHGASWRGEMAFAQSQPQPQRAHGRKVDLGLRDNSLIIRQPSSHFKFLLVIFSKPVIQSRLSKTLVNIFWWFSSFIKHKDLISDPTGSSLKTKHQITTDSYLKRFLCVKHSAQQAVWVISVSPHFTEGKPEAWGRKHGGQGHSSKKWTWDLGQQTAIRAWALSHVSVLVPHLLCHLGDTPVVPLAMPSG